MRSGREAMAFTFWVFDWELEIKGEIKKIKIIDLIKEASFQNLKN
jgi:hypothetical protein